MESKKDNPNEGTARPLENVRSQDDGTGSLAWEAKYHACALSSEIQEKQRRAVV